MAGCAPHLLLTGKSEHLRDRVGMGADADMAVLVPEGSRFRTLADLLAAAKAAPGKLDIATVNVGSTQNLAAELFKSTAGVSAQVVPFNGTPAVVTALRGGEERPAELQPRLLEVSPSATLSGNQTRPSGSTWGGAVSKGNLGASVKYGITSTVTLRASGPRPTRWGCEVAGPPRRVASAMRSRGASDPPKVANPTLMRTGSITCTGFTTSIADTRRRIDQLKRIVEAPRNLKNPYRTHPQLETFVGSASPHPMTDFGCTSCHRGLDRADPG